MAYNKKPLTRIDQAALDAIIARHGLFRRKRPNGARAELVCHDLSQLSLRGHDLAQANFSGSLFYETDLSHATLDHAVFFACDLRRANLCNATLIRADLRGACLRGATMTGANLSDADLREGSFATYDPDKGLNFAGQEERTAAVDMRGAALGSARFTGSTAVNANFQDADLNKASFIRGDLSGANLSGANLAGANLSQCVLKNVNMRGAIMIGTVIEPANLASIDTTGALTNDPAGKLLSQLPVSFPELLELHKLWLNTKGARGARLDLSGFDLRSAPPLAAQDLTMLIAERSIWFSQNLSRTNLQAAQLGGSVMRNCRLESTDLRGSNFAQANLVGSALRKASLEPLHLDGGRVLTTNFSGANLRYTDFTQADLRDVDFTGADLSYADFTGADIRGAHFENTLRTETKADLKTLNKSGEVA